jgi:hypothetical protein
MFALRIVRYFIRLSERGSFGIAHALLFFYVCRIKKGETQSTSEAFVFLQKALDNGTTLFPTSGKF